MVRHRGVGRPGGVRPRRPDRAWPKASAKRLLLSLDRVPLTRGGKIGFHVENTLAAIAAAWSLGVPRDVIRARAESFALDLDKVPGRFNMLEIDGATVVVDYGHNPRPAGGDRGDRTSSRTRIARCVYSTAGDRRDCDMIRQGQLLGEAFDHVILYEDHYNRGRADGEIIAPVPQGNGHRQPRQADRGDPRRDHRRSKRPCARRSPANCC